MSAFRNFIMTFLMSVVIFGLCAFGLIKLSKNVINSDTPVDTADPDDTGDFTADTQEYNPVDLSSIKGESFTALIVGTDYQPSLFDDYTVSGNDEHGFPKQPRRVETDALILIHVDKETGDCIFCSVPAKTRISIDGLYTTLENLYAAKGISALCSKVAALTGLPIDYYAVITGDDFIKLIDDLGGITYYVSTNMQYVNAEKGLNINLKKGSQKLNGKKCLDMLRFPDYSDGDTSRRKVGVSLAKQLCKNYLTQKNMNGAAGLYSKYSGYFETNFKSSDLEDNLELIFAYSRMNVLEYNYPGSTVGSGDDAYFNANVTKATEYFSKYKYQG